MENRRLFKIDSIAYLDEEISELEQEINSLKKTIDKINKSKVLEELEEVERDNFIHEMNILIRKLEHIKIIRNDIAGGDN
jgi:hypothetical protein